MNAARSFGVQATSFMKRTLLPVLSALVLAACGGATPQVATTPLDPLAPTTLYPMPEGAQWVYDVDTGGDEPHPEPLDDLEDMDDDDDLIPDTGAMAARVNES